MAKHQSWSVSDLPSVIVLTSLVFCRNPSWPAEIDLCRQAIGGWSHTGGLQHPEGVYSSLGTSPAWWHADLCQDIDWQNHHPGSGEFWHYRQCQEQNPGQGRWSLTFHRFQMNHWAKCSVALFQSGISSIVRITEEGKKKDNFVTCFLFELQESNFRFCYRNSSWSAEADFCWKAAWRWTHTCGLQYPEGINFASGVASARWSIDEFNVLCV